MRHSPVLPILLVAACGGGTKHAPAPHATGPADHAIHHDEPGGGSVAPVTPPSGPPVAEKRPASNTYHGVTVDDPYQWLEGDGDDVKAWSDGQNVHARKILDNLPGVATLRDELHAIIAAPLTRYGSFVTAGGKVFATRKQPTKEQSEIVVMDSPEHAADARLIFDPTASGDPTTSFDWFVPSPDGTKVAVSVSAGGSESGSLHVFDLDGKDLEPVIPGVQQGTGGGDATWTADGRGIYYTRYPAAGEKPDDERAFWLQVWFHKLGTPVDQDHYEMGKDLPKIAEIKLDTDAGGRVLASVQNGDGGTFRHYLHDKKGWHQLTDWGDQIVSMSFGPGSDLWLISTKDAPHGKLLKLAPTAKLARAKVVVAEGTDTITTSFSDEQGAVVIKSGIYLTYQLGGPNTIRAFSLAGKPAKSPVLPDVSSSGLVPTPAGKDLLLWSGSYVVPGAWYRFTPATGALAAIDAVSPKPPVSLDGWEVHREVATSKDGTQVPVNIVWHTGAAKDGSVPCLVTGYGGYGINQEPYFLSYWYPLMSRGVCFVEVNLRGGAEFGEAWHRAGALTSKQNVFDDFAAALDYVASQKYSSPAHLAILGGSNGGLLMGATLTQHPDKMKVVVSEVGIYDMLRVELSANGLYNTTEFGTVQDEAQFAALYAYSPYHHVVAGTRYPAILMTTGANDPRVAPWHSRKMIAALQAAQAGDAPIILRTSASSGHGIGTAMTERIDQGAHVYAFILAQLGINVAAAK